MGVPMTMSGSLEVRFMLAQAVESMSQAKKIKWGETLRRAEGLHFDHSCPGFHIPAFR
jgi:hypothetical protein